MLGYSADNSSARENGSTASVGAKTVSGRPADKTNLRMTTEPEEGNKATASTIAKTNLTDTTSTVSEEKAVPYKCFFFNLPVIFVSGRDLALFFLWMFLAGFSERLVPDLLTKVAEQKKS
jgi:hypothetical protein